MKMLARISIALFTVVMVLNWSVLPSSAATEEEIEQSIDDGIAWLTGPGMQNADGSWGVEEWDRAAYTAFVLIKLQDRAYEKEFDSPFDPAYPYSDNVIAGWEYLFTNCVDKTTPLPVQIHGANLDDPDTSNSGYGLYFSTNGSHSTYTTGIVLMALKASRRPDRANEGGEDFDGDTVTDTYLEIAQELVDWLAYAQGDCGLDEGGYYYADLDNACIGGADNSNSGYAYLGLAAGEGFGCTVPQWVKNELNVWIGNIQDPVNGDLDDGGSYYNPSWLPGTTWVNELKTGNLIFEMTYFGDDPSSARFQDAMDYIVRLWQDQNQDPGWGYSPVPATASHYQAMFCLMKGLEYSQIELIDLDTVGDPEHDWFEEFSTVLVGQQWPDGHWEGGAWGGDILNTVWALLTLERIIPPPPKVTVSIDIKPQSCPNPLNTKSNGVLPVAVLGAEDFDVSTIDPDSIMLGLEGVEDGVSPIRHNYEDVATPFDGDLCDCHDLDGDGYLDLTLKFKTQDLVGTLDLNSEVGNTIALTLTGNLKEEYGGTAIEGQDCIRVQRKGK